MSHGTTWQHQWDRIMRWRERVRLGRDQVRTDGLGTEGYRDEVFALMQAIWHLKDWLINDDDVDADRSTINALIRGKSTYLHVAHDVANGSKHMLLTNEYAGGSEQTRNDASVHVGTGVSHSFYVRDARLNVDHEVVKLADRCLEEWKTILAELGIADT